MTIEAVQNYNRIMAPVFSDLDSLPVYTFFNTLFTSGETIIEPDAEAIDIDIQRGNKKISVYIPRGTDAENNGDLETALLEKYSNVARIFPLVEEVSPINSSMIGKRMPGENPYAPMSRTMKQAALAMKAHREHMTRIIRTLEFSACEAFRLGEQTVLNGIKYDYYRRADHNQTVAVPWATSATAAPVSDLATAGNKVFRNGNRIPTDIIFGSGAWEDFLNTVQIQNLAESRRIIHFATDMNETAIAGYEAWVAAGAIFQGQIKAGDFRFNMWTYPAVYDNGTTSTLYVPDEQVMVYSKDARRDRYFGPSDTLAPQPQYYRDKFGIEVETGVPMNVVTPGIFQPAMFHLDAFGGDNGKSFSVRSQCAPIFAPVEIDTIVKIEVG